MNITPEALERIAEITDLTTEVDSGAILVRQIVDYLNLLDQESDQYHGQMTDFMQTTNNQDWRQLLDVMRVLERYDPGLFTQSDRVLLINIRVALKREIESDRAFSQGQDRPRPIARQFLTGIQQVINRYNNE